MIQPHGNTSLNPLYISDEIERESLINESQQLKSILLSSMAAANAVMLGGGYFTPLSGYMNLSDSLSVSQSLKTNDGLFWPIPIINLVDDVSNISCGESIALRDPNLEGNPVLAVMNVQSIESVSDADMSLMLENIFGTVDKNHPGVASFSNQGRFLISGPIKVLNFSYFPIDFPDTFKTAYEIRNEIEILGWDKVVAFQTRNPMHRAHEELCRMAISDLSADGCLIHMLLGKLKSGDIPANVRDASIRKMVEIYFPPNTVMVTGYGFDMLYAGPREALLHAIFRQNCGCSHLIVGRDHAGVGDYYGAFDAQTIFDTVPDGALKIDIYRADHTAFSKKLNKVVMMKDAQDHSKDDFVLLSGTKVREMLGNGIAPPPEFSRPEVAEILMDYYKNL